MSFWFDSCLEMKYSFLVAGTSCKKWRNKRFANFPVKFVKINFNFGVIMQIISLKIFIEIRLWCNFDKRNRIRKIVFFIFSSHEENLKIENLWPRIRVAKRRNEHSKKINFHSKNTKYGTKWVARGGPGLPPWTPIWPEVYNKICQNLSIITNSTMESFPWPMTKNGQF